MGQGMVDQTMKVLIVEDSESDAGLVLRMLRKSGHQVDARRVETANELRSALEKQVWDVVIADYTLPQLNAPEALALVQQSGLDIPFIVISGVVGEETAVEMLKAGAHDYLGKDRLFRLSSAVEREIREARARGERQREQQALKESKARFLTIFQASPVLISIARLADGRFIDVNPAWEALTGYTRQEVIGCKVVDLDIWVNPSDQQRIQDEIFSQGRVRDLECQIRHRSGRVADLNLSIEPIELAGEPCLVSMAQDITPRKQAEEALRESEAHYRAVTETAHDAIITTDQRGLIVDWNQSARRMFGYRMEEVSGQPLARLLTEASRPPGMGIDRDFPVDGNVELIGNPVERRGLCKDGRTIPLEVSQAAWEAKHGQFITSILRDIGERKRTEEFLYLQRSALEAAANAILLTNRQGIIRWANRAFTALTGYTQQEVLGKDVGDLTRSGAHPPSFYKELWETILSGRVWQGEVINRRKDSSNYFEYESITPIVDNNGVITSFVAIKQDITRQKQAEQALLEEKERYRSLYENVPVGLYRTTPAGQILMANPALVHMLGFSSFDDLAQMNIEARYAQEDSRRQFRQRLEQEGVIQGFVSGFLRKDGSLIYISESGRAVRDLDGRVLYYEGTIEDITQIRQSEQQNRRLAAVIEQAAEMVIVSDASGRIQYVNPAFQKMFNISTQEVVGRDISSFNSLDQDAQDWEQILQIPRSGSVWRGNISLRRGNGKVLDVEITVSPVRDLENEISSLVYLMRDITQERLVEIQHRQSQKLEAIGQLAAGIAHEINTPTQFIGNNIRFIQNGFQDLMPLLEKYHDIVHQVGTGEISQHEIEEAQALEQRIDTGFLAAEIPAALEGSLKGIDRVTRIVSAMREFSHPGEHEKALADINHAIENTLIVSRNEWKYVAELTTDLDPGLPLVPCLVDEFNQVILNLITNAADSIRDMQMQEGEHVAGQIQISTSHTREWVIVKVSDNGTGIPEHIRQRIFEPFFTTKEVGKGSGQGLPISYDLIVNKHGGKIEFETQEGLGTTFIIHLPVRPGGASGR